MINTNGLKLEEWMKRAWFKVFQRTLGETLNAISVSIWLEGYVILLSKFGLKRRDIKI